MADTRVDELRRRLERDPGSRLFAQLAEELRKTGELAEAIGVARAGLAVHTAYPSARLTLGRALLDSGDPAGARAELESVLRDAPDNILASRYLAQACEGLGDLRGAAEQYKKTLLMAPGDRQLQGALASVEGRLGAAAPVAVPTPAPTPRPVPPPLPSAAAARPTAPPPPPPPAAQAPAATRAALPPTSAGGVRPTAPPPAETESEAAALPPTLRIHGSQPMSPPPPARPAAEPAPVDAAEEPATLPGTAASTQSGPAVEAFAEAAREPAPEASGQAPSEPAEAEAASPSASTAPFSSSTLAELYYQQGLVERAVDVYRQVVEQEPENDKARGRLRELEGAGAPAPDREARRKALEQTIAGLETLLLAVRRR